MEIELYELVYKIEKEKGDLRLLGEEFFIRNKIKGIMVYKRKKFKLKEKIPFNELKNIKDNELKIEMIFFNKIYNKSYMFKNCISLLKFSFSNNIIKKYNSNSINMFEEEENLFDDYYDNNISINNEFLQYLENENLFPDYSTIIKKQKYSELSTIKNIYNNNLKEIKDHIIKLEGMFFNCSSLKYLYGISEWDTRNVNSINSLFNNCSSLITLPDISNWNTDYFNDISFLFNGYSSLKSLPDISIWTLDNVSLCGGMFDYCSSLSILPGISKWNID